MKRLLIIVLLTRTAVLSSYAQSDVSIGSNYQFNIQRQTLNADAYLLHNAKVDASPSATFRWETTHSSFGSRGIIFSYYQGIRFVADAIPTASGTQFIPTIRMLIGNDGNIGIGTETPRGKFDVDGPGDIFLADDVNQGTTQSVYLPGHIYISPYNQGNVSYIQARRHDNSGTTSLRFRTYSDGVLNDAMHIEGNGSVGIGNTNPDGVQISSSLTSQLSRGSDNVRLGVLDGAPRIILDDGGYNTFQLDNLEGRFRIYTPGIERFTILSNGNVGIGTSNPGTFRLAVEGKIGAREVNVNTTTPWPDYVFKQGYDLLPLDQLQCFIETHNHLPQVPTADEVQANGIELGEMNALLLRKIEELTLYVLELKEENNRQNKLIHELQKK